MKNTLPDNRDNGDTRDDGERTDTAVGPLACLATAIGLTTIVLAPCLAAAGFAGAAALLAATMLALFATLLVIVSVSVAAAIATMFLSPVAAATQDTAFRPPVRKTALARASPGAAARGKAGAPAVGRAFAVILNRCGRDRPSVGGAPLPDGTARAAATLMPSPRERHETA